MTSAARRYAEPGAPRRIALGRRDLADYGMRNWVGQKPRVVFVRKLSINIRPEGEGYRCEIPELDASAWGATRFAANQAVATALREETATLLATLTHELDPEQRARKRLLLGSVDVLLSGLVRNVAVHAWVVGAVEVDPAGRRWFRAIGSEGERYELAPDLAGGIPSDSFVRMAKVRAGSIGEPVGPVVELGRPLGTDPEAVWTTWERKVEEHE